MQEVLAGLLAWIGSQTGYNVDLSLPNVSLTEPYNVCMNYGIKHKGQCDAAHLKGFYNKHYTIYLQNNFNLNNKHDRSALMHELVHYVQWSNQQQKSTCLGQLEVEAYDLQDKWREHYHLGAVLDPFKRIMLQASCDD
jgi:hypothetical protein